jgi:tRNA-Thr(GGU) m(6)t(6)A37 methyltransferase TsaA
VYVLKPIGVVEKGFPKPGDPDRANYRSRYEFVGAVRVYDEFVDGLLGLDEYSHVILLYVFHEEGRSLLRVQHKRSKRELGIFATRSPARPNPIGVSVVELVKLEAPRLWLRGLDAWTGSPVVDIKPYSYYDVVKQPKVAKEAEEEWAEKSKLYSELAPWLGPYTRA